MDDKSPPSSVSNRQIRKLWPYILGFEAVSEAINAIDTQKPVNETGCEKILQKILPELSKAFDSEGAFYTDKGGKICFVHPESSQLVGKILPPADTYIESLLRCGKPLIIVKSKDIPPKLSVLGIQSLLVMPLDVPWGKYFVGVHNGQDDPAYDGEDKKFFKTLMEILGLGFKYGRQTETWLAHDRYLHAQRSGRYNFLSRASEDYARFTLPLQKSTLNVQRRSKVAPDDLLADYLDAELCRIIQDFEPRLKQGITNGDTAEKAQTAELPNHLLSLIELTGESQSFCVTLRDNTALTKPLELRGYPRTALAVARIGLWVGYIKAGARVPGWPDEQKSKLDSLPEDLCKVEAVDLFYTLPNWLLKVVEPGQTKAKRFHSVQWRIDWLRTLWQKIHYLARNGVSEPRREWVEEIVNAFTQVCPLTISMLQMYLSDHVSKQGLRMDSDWLTVWMVSNVLLSKGLTRHYVMKDPVGGKEPISSPVEKMRYFTHLSHLVLYALHCARHLHREKEVQKRLKPNVIVERLPFAEVPVDLSLGLSKSQLYILSEYAYREIGVHRELALFERLARQLCYELPLYAANESYRDHLFHVIDVCLLGELLLRSKAPPCTTGASEDLVDLFRKGVGRGRSRSLMQNWYIAALCHDLGYVIERTRDLLGSVRAIEGPGLKQFWEAVKSGLTCGRNEIKQVIEDKLSNSRDAIIAFDDLKEIAATDHGVAAWLHLNHWLDQVKVPPQKLTPALNAILRHNLPEPQVSCRREPLTLLLMLCDHLQEWGRPRVGPDPLAMGVMEALRFSTQPEFERKVRVKQLVIEGLKIVPTTQNDPIQTQIEPGGLEFKLSHVESREGDFEPAISWLLLCRDLQCFGNQGGELPVDIKIILEHTPSRIWHMMPWKPLEMDLVQEFASGYKPAMYLCEWINKAHHGEDGIHYEGNRDTGVETFTIHLNKLGRPLQRGLSDEHWQRFFEWKWRRLGRQFIGLSLGDWFPEL